MAITITPRRSEERGHANHGWLDSYHTFSFASYWDARFEQYGPLRVINEDIVQGGAGFPTHPHREFEIWSYVVSGELMHKDSTGTHETIKRGQVQFTTAGTGVTHSEFNAHPKDPVHFIQIWAKPDQSRLPPNYVTMEWDEDDKINKLCLIIKPTGKAGARAIQCHTDLWMYASILKKDNQVVHSIEASGRKQYIHLINTGGKLEVGGVQLNSGDGAFISEANQGDQLVITSIGEEPAEFLLFDMQ
ncbi:RmlC-like cupin [Basidiobolus meristosporus CBS 931.73]|uniref:RmlC-like cupin n=1 Tax=Basidiobolus meristosporus CBS 931.73 TaxID=1314790 RepID=A0A1Y1Y9M3_9FUNG|nr:RmlC-like cupin [Basidiobolus meristosporus CBS 931.73]|eukprot:ORX94446.1 RmlC-like cupin [Basidiobolus meristosporus CBS 931.73]